jgi:hypothetical protein
MLALVDCTRIITIPGTILVSMTIRGFPRFRVER